MKTIINMKAMEMNEEMLEQVHGGASQEDGSGFFDFFKDLFHISRRGLMTFDPREADRSILDHPVDVDNVHPFNQKLVF